MVTITTRIPDALNQKLESLAQDMERSKSHLLRKALMNYLEDLNDYQEASQILAQKNRRYSLKEVEQELGLES